MNDSLEVIEIVRRWITKADLDIAAAQAIIDRSEAWGVACYCTQQAAERAVKALLTFHNLHAPRTHDIEHLHSMLPDGSRLAIPTADLAYLSTYGIDPWWEPDRHQAEKALRIARAIVGQICQLLENAGVSAYCPST